MKSLSLAVISLLLVSLALDAAPPRRRFRPPRRDRDGVKMPRVREVQQTLADFTTSKIWARVYAGSGLAAELKDKNVTYLVPNDEAFEKMSPEEIEALLKDTDKLAQLVRRHSIAGEALMVDDLVARGEVAGASRPITFKKDDSGFYQADRITIVNPNIAVRNGVMHVIEGLLPAPPD